MDKLAVVARGSVGRFLTLNEKMEKKKNIIVWLRENSKLGHMVNSPLTQVKRDLIRSALAVVEGNRQKERKKTKTMGGGGG